MPYDFTLTVPSNFQFRTPSILSQAASPLSAKAGISSSAVHSAVTSSMVTSSDVRKKYESSCFSIIHRYFADLIENVHFFFHSLFYPTINSTVSKAELRNIYFGLGENKWREGIDGCHHAYGKLVYDQGLHGGTKEPGFISSLENAYQFVAGFLGRKVDAMWYLRLHKHTCGHFNGDKSVFLMGQEKVGVFRDKEDVIGANFPNNIYQVTPEALQEFYALDAELKRLFGDSYGLGFFEDLGHGKKYLYYKPMTRDQITQIFNKFLNDFYQEVEQAAPPDQKLQAIAKLHQRLEWLHPVRDGTSRTSIAFMNKNLIDYGFHPAILEYPHLSSSYGLRQWTEYLRNGLRKWEQSHA